MLNTGTPEATAKKLYLCVHGHFYQPPRLDPITGDTLQERGCEPYHDFNEKITAECYRPNAQMGNFKKISFDLGPTLASWMEKHDPETYNLIVAANREHFFRYGYGNAMAQAYNHTILPLSSSLEKRTQIIWGIADFQARFGHRPEGMWLPETAADYESLEIMAEQSIEYTVLAPWQAAGHVDTTEPYIVRLGNGRSITVFFFDEPLNAAVSFNPHTTINADNFVTHHLQPRLNAAKQASGQEQLILVATDGELYGHHLPQRHQFLNYLLNNAAPQHGFEVVSLARYLRLSPPRREVAIRENTSWSCLHGVTRWNGSCACVPGDGSWKGSLRRAFNRLAAKIDMIFALETGLALRDPIAAVQDYVAFRSGSLGRQEFWKRHAAVELSDWQEKRVERLLEMVYFRHLMFTSCAFFFEDVDRMEPRNSIAYAANAIRLAGENYRAYLEDQTLGDLRSARSGKSLLTAEDTYQRVTAEARTALARMDQERGRLAA